MAKKSKIKPKRISINSLKGPGLPPVANDAPPAAKNPNKTATNMTIKDPDKKPKPLVFGFLDRDNNRITIVKVVGLMAATRAMGTASDNNETNSDI
jgi:hypothetical protein